MKKQYGSCAEWLKAEYNGPYIATDIVIRYQKGVVLIERKFEPLGIAVPGGIAERMTLPENVVKEAHEETGLDITLDNPTKPLCVLSEVNQDPRAFICSVTYTATGSGILRPKPDEDAKSAKVYSYDQVYALLNKPVWAFSHHKKIMHAFLKEEGYSKKPKKGQKGDNYFLIEEYSYDTRVGADTKYDVRKFTSAKAMQQALLQGPQNKGKLTPAKEIKLEVVVNESL